MCHGNVKRFVNKITKCMRCGTVELLMSYHDGLPKVKLRSSCLHMHYFHLLVRRTFQPYRNIHTSVGL